MNLIDVVLKQLAEDVKNLDFTAIEELLGSVDKDALRAYLPEHAEVDEDEYDGQPDEAQEWADFDPDC